MPLLQSGPDSNHIFRGKIVDVQVNNYTIEITGTSDKLDVFSKTLNACGEVIESSRTGICGLARGDRALRP